MMTCVVLSFDDWSRIKNVTGETVRIPWRSCGTILQSSLWTPALPACELICQGSLVVEVIIDGPFKMLWTSILTRRTTAGLESVKTCVCVCVCGGGGGGWNQIVDNQERFEAIWSVQVTNTTAQLSPPLYERDEVRRLIWSQREGCRAAGLQAKQKDFLGVSVFIYNWNKQERNQILSSCSEYSPFNLNIHILCLTHVSTSLLCWLCWPMADFMEPGNISFQKYDWIKIRT